MRDTQDAERAVRTPAGTWKLPDKSSRCCSTGSLSVLVMLASRSPAKEFVSLREKRTCHAGGRGARHPEGGSREGAEQAELKFGTG